MARRMAQDNLKIKDPDYYMFEGRFVTFGKLTFLLCARIQADTFLLKTNKNEFVGNFYSPIQSYHMI